MDDIIQSIKNILHIKERAETSQSEKLALETVLYLVISCAFGMFVRWMQKMLAFDDDGLPEGGFWNVAYVAIIIIACFVFIKRIDRLKNLRMYIPKELEKAYSFKGKVLNALIILSSVIIIAGAVLLYAGTETEKTVQLLRINAGMAIVSAFILPLLLRTANTGLIKLRFRPLLSAVPVFWLCEWLISTYVRNSINSVVLDFGLEIITVCVLMVTFFRFAGIFFASFNPNRTLFFCMLGTFMCTMCLADSRLIGLQVMLFGIALFLGTFTWILVSNAQEEDNPGKIAIDNGFERLQ